MNCRIISFTDRGEAVARLLADALDCGYDRCAGDVKLGVWTEKYFSECDSLIFVGAAGVAVRAIAPYIKSKAEDPAVVVIDEKAIHAVSLLSGHLGGANALTRKVAEITGAAAVITTATDLSGLFAVDEWARVHGFYVADTAKIKKVSSKLLQGNPVTYLSDWDISGDAPEGLVRAAGDTADIRLSVFKGDKKALHVVPKVLMLGIGCRKGASLNAIEEMFDEITGRFEIYREAFACVCSIDIKKEEKGLLAFAEKYGFETVFFTADELNSIEGDYTASDFVKYVAHVDNVCERSAVLASGGGDIIVKKNSHGGVTMAAAVKAAFAPEWSY